MNSLLNLGIQIGACQLLKLLGVPTCPVAGIILVCILIAVRVYAVDVGKVQRIEVMLDTMANEDRFATDLLQVLSHLTGRGCIAQPAHPHTMNRVEAACDGCLWVHKGVKEDSTVLVDDTNLADHTRALTLVHLTVDGHEQRKVSLGPTT